MEGVNLSKCHDRSCQIESPFQGKKRQKGQVHGKAVSSIACECVGGNVTTDFQYELVSAKASVDGSHEGSNGLLKVLLVQYGDPATRWSGFTDRDAVMQGRNNATAKLMKEYAYSLLPMHNNSQQSILCIICSSASQR
eukprot:scaffold5855_cov90-Skeletonema_dohrnii-CCMP3373.AAC.2